MHTTFFDRFKQAVLSNPEKPAFIFEEKQLSYAELDEKSDSLASILCAKGIAERVPGSERLFGA